jgi:polyisoprenoid-binding protein YceI
MAVRGFFLSLIKALLSLTALQMTLVAAQDKAIDVQRSTITVHVGKAGLFSVAGHEHWVSAPISAGVVDDSNAPHVEFTVDASKMSVKPDPKVDAKTQSEIQRDMQEMTLESARFPQIAFRSSRVEILGKDEWKVHGTLTLHGVTKPIVVMVRRDGGMYFSHAILKQTDFGIKPITVGGGLVKVKNEVEVDFKIATLPQ